MSDTNWRSASRKVAAGYFCFYGAFGTWIPFATLYYKQLGFNGWQISLLSALPAIWALATGPLWGSVADSRSLHGLIMRIVPLVAAVATIWMALTEHFWLFTAGLALQALAMAPIPSFLDSYAIISGERGGSSYGALRIFGSLGFTVVVVLMGFLMNDEVSRLNLLCFAVGLGVLSVATFNLPKIGERSVTSLTAGIQYVVRNREYVLLLVVAYLLACSYTMINMYYGVHVASLGGSTQLIGIAFALGALTEVPIIGLGTWWIRKLGIRNLVTVSIALYVVRFAMLGFVTSPTLAVGSNLLHGPGYGGFLVASVILAHRLVGGEYAATAQALLSTMSFGTGAITGALIGGALISVDTSLIYRGVSVVTLIALVLWLVGPQLVRRHDSRGI